MVHPQNLPADDNDLKLEVERQTRFLELLLDEQEPYENRKETGAYAVLLLQIGFTAYVITASEWPPKWVHAYPYPTLFVPIVLILSWLLLHIFARWQLRNRRFAAIETEALINTLRKWAHTRPIAEELAPYEPNENDNALHSSVLDYFVPWSSSRVRGDLGKNGFPNDLVREWIRRENEGTNAVKSEWIQFIASVALLVLMLLRTFSGK